MIDGFAIGERIDREVAQTLKAAPPNKKNRPQYHILAWRLREALKRIEERVPPEESLAA